MKNKIFNIALYKDALKQTKLIGIMAAIVLFLEAILVPIAAQVIMWSDYKRYQMDTPISELGIDLVTAGGNVLTIMPLLVGMIVLIVPIMTLYLFRFQNNRAASDCYHALPQTRTCLFLSFHAAIATWTVAIVLISDLLFFLTVSLCNLVRADMYPVFVGSMAVIAGSIMVQGAVAFAMSLTGTTFSNLLVAVMILFVPRGLWMVGNAFIVSEIPYLVNIDGFFDTSLNIPVNLFYGIFSSDTWMSGFCKWSAVFYTLGIGVLYFALAEFFQVRRKSESATHAGVNQHVQTIFRVVPAFSISLIAVYLIWRIIFGEDEWMSIEREFFLVVIYIISLITYMLYELVTTRQWKNVIRSLPRYLWVLVLDGAFLAVCGIGYQAVANQKVSLDEMEGYRIIADDVGYYTSLNDWYKQKASKIVLQDESSKLLVARLEEQIQENKEGNFSFKYLCGDYSKVNVSFQTKTGSLERKIYLSSEEKAQIDQAILNNESYRQVYMTLPEKEDIYSYYGDLMSFEEVEQAQFEEFYDTLIEEIQEKGFDTWYHVLSNGDDSIIDTLKLRFMSEIVSIPITWTYPKSTALYLEFCRSSQDTIQEMLSSFQAMDTDKISYINIDLTWNGWKNNVWQTNSAEYYKDMSDGMTSAEKEQLQLLCDTLEQLVSKEDYDMQDGYLVLNYSWESSYEYMDIYYESGEDSMVEGYGSVIVPCTMDEAKELWSILDYEF